jgi:hypothetical protein
LVLPTTFCDLDALQMCLLVILCGVSDVLQMCLFVFKNHLLSWVGQRWNKGVEFLMRCSHKPITFSKTFICLLHALAASAVQHHIMRVPALAAHTLSRDGPQMGP